MAAATNSKVLPTRTYWVAILLLLVMATVATITTPGGWVMWWFPVWVYLIGRGVQQENEGVKM